MIAALQGLPQKLTADEYSKLQEVFGFKDELIEGEAGTDAVVEVDYTKRYVVIHRPEREAAEVVTDSFAWPFTAELVDIFRNLDQLDK